MKLVGDGKEDLLVKILGGFGGMLGVEFKEEEKLVDVVKEVVEDVVDVVKIVFVFIF